MHLSYSLESKPLSVFDVLRTVIYRVWEHKLKESHFCFISNINCKVWLISDLQAFIDQSL